MNTMPGQALHQNAAIALNLTLQDIRRVAVTTVAYQFSEEALADWPQPVRLALVAQHSQAQAPT
jgi:hypothetical protein